MLFNHFALVKSDCKNLEINATSSLRARRQGMADVSILITSGML